MGRNLKKMILLGVAASLVMLLAGCQRDRSVEDLFTLPETPLAYEGLSQKINELVTTGYEYAAPTSGENIQTVQMVDINGDGVREAVAFFRETTGEKQLKIVVFRQSGEDYQQMCLIESSGSSIDTVDYCDFDGDGTLEMAVGWRISTEVRTVAVYRIKQEPEMLLQSGYTRSTIGDMNKDGRMDLIVFRAGEEGKNIAELYAWAGQEKVSGMPTALTVTMAELGQGSIVLGQLAEGVPALFVTGVNTQKQAVTDILCYRQGGLTNVALDSLTGISRVTAPYAQLRPQDINNDGVIEIPIPQQTEIQPDEDEQTDDQTQPAVMELTGLITWRCYDVEGKSKDVCRTYHATSEGWYFMLPDEWRQVTAVVLDGGSYERQATLLLDGRPMVNIYTITGENRESRAMKGRRFVLRRQTATIYAAELYENTGTSEALEKLVRDGFHLMIATW